MYHHVAMTDPNGAAIYGVPWIPSRNTPFMLANIYHTLPYMDPMGYEFEEITSHVPPTSSPYHSSR